MNENRPIPYQTPHGLAKLLGPLVGLAFSLLGPHFGLTPAAAHTAGVTAWCAIWWITEVVPIGAASLLPFVLFPFLGVLSPLQLAEAYGHPVILLLLGGFMLSAALEQSGAHRRLALALLHHLGGRSDAHLVLAFMATAALLSMWISNSATTLMLLPVATAVLDRGENDAPLQRALLLGIAYAASIGGLATPIGTPPNAIFIGVYEQHFGEQLSFLWWMRIGVPASVLLLPLAWWWLCRNLDRGPRLGFDVKAQAWSKREQRVLWVFAVIALGWMTRTAPFGGWGGAFGLNVSDGTVALAGVLTLFCVPGGDGRALLTWKAAGGIPWHLLLLFAGGIAIAKAFTTSGLSAAVSTSLDDMATWPAPIMIALICLVVTFLTEVTSNTATATLLMPLLAAAAGSAGLPATQLMVPAALSCSCAFMLPVSTPPNAIAFATGHLRVQQMARAGLMLNLFGVVVITLLCVLLL